MATEKGLSISPIHKVRLTALNNTRHKYTKIPQLPDLFTCIKCHHCTYAEVSAISNSEIEKTVEVAPNAEELRTEIIGKQCKSTDSLEIEDFKSTSLSSSSSLIYSENGQYRVLQCDDLSTDICHHLLIILAQQNQVCNKENLLLSILRGRDSCNTVYISFYG